MRQITVPNNRGRITRAIVLRFDWITNRENAVRKRHIVVIIFIGSQPGMMLLNEAILNTQPAKSRRHIINTIPKDNQRVIRNSSGNADERHFICDLFSDKLSAISSFMLSYFSGSDIQGLINLGLNFFSENKVAVFIKARCEYA